MPLPCSKPRAAPTSPGARQVGRAAGLQGLHRTRSLWMGTRTSRINALRGFCREFGIAIAAGQPHSASKQIGRVLADPHSAVPDADPRHDAAAGRGDPPAGSAHRAARARADRAGPASRRRAPRCCRSPASACSPPPRWWPPPPATSATSRMRATSPPGSASRPRNTPRAAHAIWAHLQARRSLPAHAAHPRRRRAARRQRGAHARARPSMACATGRSPCRPAPITTRPPARSPTSWRASATRRCVTSATLRTNRSLSKKMNRAGVRAAGLKSPCNRIHLASSLATEIDRPSWQPGSHPTPLDADNSAGSSTLAACNDWRTGDADSMSARAITEPTTDAGYTTAGSSLCHNYRSVSCLWGGVHI